jgi:hypothetical protein
MVGRDRRSTLRANARTGATAVGLSEFEKERLLTDALVYEGQQHWLHYRHIEQERNQFLGFFFTLLVAVVGFFVAISARATSWPALAMGLTAMAAVVGMINLLIFISVRKFGAALHVYDRDVERIRASLFALVESGRTHLAAEHRTVAMRMRHRPLHRLVDPQFAAEVIVGTFAAAAFGVQVFVAAAALVSDDFSAGQRTVACALAAASIAGGTTLAGLWIKGGGLHGG